MAFTEQEIAQQILNGTYGQVQQQVPEQLPPEALQPNAPDALVVTAPAQNDFQMPAVDPALAAASQAADAQAMQQNTDMQMGYTPPGQRRPEPGDVMLTPAQLAQANAAGPQFSPAATSPAPAAPEQPQAAPAPVVEPAPAVQAQADANIVAPAVQQIAEHKATLAAADAVQKQMAEEAANLQKQQDAIQAEINQQDDSVRNRSLQEIMQRGSYGDKIGASIALLFGGISQGLTGAKSNPVMDFIDRSVQQQAEKDKLSSEQKLSLKKQLLEVAQLRMKNAENASNDQFHKGTLQVEQGKLGVERQKVEGDQRLKAQEAAGKQKDVQLQMAAEQGQPIDNPLQLSKEQQARMVTGLDGKRYLVNNEKSVVPYNQAYSDAQPGIQGIDRIMRLSQDYNRVTDMGTRAKIQTELVALSGSLRQALLGPGAMTADEFNRLMGTIGDPTKITSLPSWEKGKLKTIQNKLQSDYEGKVKSLGIKIPESRRDALVAQARAAGASEKAIQAILKGY